MTTEAGPGGTELRSRLGLFGTLPWLNVARDRLEERVGLERVQGVQRFELFWVALLELLEQVLRFVLDLSDGYRDRFYAAPQYECGGMEGIVPPLRLDVYVSDIGSNGPAWETMFAKTFKLGVSSVSSCLALENSPRQESLTPKGKQSLGIEVTWMQRPQSHEIEYAFCSLKSQVVFLEFVLGN